jgi:5-formyltetrahydrofolate cyclo-ligase
VPAIAIAFSQQVVDGTLPAASFDRRVDAIVTEDGIVRP